MKTIRFDAHTRDSFCAQLVEKGRVIAEYDGYPPSFLVDGDGDTVSLEIDLETGQILNWKKPTEAALKKMF